MLLFRIALAGLLLAPLARFATAGLLLVSLASIAEAARPEIELTTPTGERVQIAKVRIAGATRDALRADPGDDISARCPGGPGVLIASIAAVGLPATESVVFEIEAERDGQWVPLMRESISDPQGQWFDHRIELSGEATEQRRLRLRTTATADSADETRIYWGSLRFLPAASAEPPPNVILISLDTLGAGYLGWYGGHAQASKNIDAFLERAFTFRRAYATYPNTLVSHASVLSGLYPSSHGVYGSLRDSLVSVDLLSTVLRKKGYLNVAFTEDAFVSSDFGFDRDFDWYDDGPERGKSSFLGDASVTFGRAREWLERYSEDAPFLLFVHTYEVHSPYSVHDEESLRIANGVFADAEVTSDASSAADMEHLHNAGFDRLSPDQIRRLEALHVGEIHYLDRQFADLMRALDNLPSANRTLVVVFADHGDEFEPHGKIGHGESLHDIVMHVPLAFYLPGKYEGGEYAQPVSLVDVAPTVLEFLGEPGALSVDGRSLLPLVAKQTAELEPRPVFAELQKASATCLELRLPDTCYVGRFVVYSGDQRFESSMIPHYETLQPSDGTAPEPALVDAFHTLLSSYVTGSPWSTKVPWRPQSVNVDHAPRSPIDEATRQRLEALGYDF